jgi:hypothetical protein
VAEREPSAIDPSVDHVSPNLLPDEQVTMVAIASNKFLEDFVIFKNEHPTTKDFQKFEVAVTKKKTRHPPENEVSG